MVDHMHGGPHAMDTCMDHWLMVAEAILQPQISKKMLILDLHDIQNLACGACNGYVTVKKRFVFVFCLGGPAPPEGRVGGYLPGNQKHSALELFELRCVSASPVSVQ